MPQTPAPSTQAGAAKPLKLVLASVVAIAALLALAQLAHDLWVRYLYAPVSAAGGTHGVMLDSSPPVAEWVSFDDAPRSFENSARVDHALARLVHIKGRLPSLSLNAHHISFARAEHIVAIAPRSLSLIDCTFESDEALWQIMSQPTLRVLFLSAQEQPRVDRIPALLPSSLHVDFGPPWGEHFAASAFDPTIPAPIPAPANR
ncbi:MAG: hypothetical protein ACTS3F_10450 [Phycisphaerales bacterium]